jgi:predicted phage tail protein
MPYTTKVILRGVLGERFGREWNLALDQGNAVEAFNAISRQRPGLREWLNGAAEDGIGLRVLIGGRDILYHAQEANEFIVDGQFPADPVEQERFVPVITQLTEDMLVPCGRDTIEFVPEPVAGGYTLGIAVIWIVKALIYVAKAAMVVSALYSIYSLATMRSPKASSGATSAGVRMDDYNRAEHADQQGSFSFSGAVNKRGQGKPLPLLYGRGIVGSHIGSFGIQSVRNRKKKT